jgi:hypothetical protein
MTVFSPHGATAPSGPGSHYRGFTISRHTTLGRTLDEWSAQHRDLYLITHNTHNSHAPGRIGTRNPSKLAAAYAHLRPRGHWDRHLYYSKTLIFRQGSAAPLAPSLSYATDHNKLKKGLKNNIRILFPWFAKFVEMLIWAMQMFSYKCYNIDVSFDVFIHISGLRRSY